MRLSEGDVVAAYKLHSFNRAYYLAVCAALLVFSLWALDGVLSKSHVGPGVFAFPFILFLLPALHYWYWPARFGRIYRQQKSLQQEINLCITEKGLESTTALASGITPWSHIIKWKENDQVLLAYHSEALFQIITKRELLPEEIDTLKQHVHNTGRNA